MINEWKDYYNNDYIIFSINNEIVNDQYFSTKHILNTYQSRVEFIIDNIEDFSFKNEDYINSIENDFHINYAQEVLEAEENENKKRAQKANDDPIENIDEENKIKETLNSNDLKSPNEKSGYSEGQSIENNENNIMSDEFLKEEDFAIDNQNEQNTVKAREINIITDLNEKFEKNKHEEISKNSPEQNNPIIPKIETDKDNRKVDIKDFSNLPLQKHDKNKKIEFKNFENIDLGTLEDNFDIKNTSNDKASQKELKIYIEKNDSLKEDSKESPKNYEIDKDNYKKLINNLKSQEEPDENNKYYSRKIGFYFSACRR